MGWSVSQVVGGLVSQSGGRWVGQLVRWSVGWSVSQVVGQRMNQMVSHHSICLFVYLFVYFSHH